MKKLLMFSTVALFGLATIQGCKKSDSGSGSSTTMKATINGASFNSSNCYAIASSGIATIAGYSGSSATSTTLPVIQFGFFSGTITPGTYPIDGITVQANIDSSNSSAAIVASSGTITITSVSPNFVGTFSFTCSDGTTVTGGTFSSKTY